MLPKDERGNEMFIDVVEKFRTAGALSPETAVDYTKIGVCPETRQSDKDAINYLIVMSIVKKYKKKFYLDEVALENPNRAYFKKVMKNLAVCAPIILVLVLLFFFLDMKQGNRQNASNFDLPPSISAENGYNSSELMNQWYFDI
ncbi:MAG: hypothetical protein IKU25_04815 [Clostridia bacterium]|nr:hypothetical protein [Clostridia bacterium]